MNAKEYLLDCKAKLVAEQTRQINITIIDNISSNLFFFTQPQSYS